MTPQLRYMREARQDPLFRAWEAERQRIRRQTERYRAWRRAYDRKRRLREEARCSITPN